VTEALLSAWGGERLVVRPDLETGAWVIVAIHSTVLGPAAGGTRMKTYPDLDSAVIDALRLSSGMTLKFAAPGLPFGGGKAVIALPPDFDPVDRPALLRRYGEVISEFGGMFRTGPDVGTTPEDMDVIASTAGPFVFCRTPAAGGAGDPGPYTALGVVASIEAVCERLFGDPSVLGRRVLVQGAGDVGGPVIRRLVAAGADVSFSEISDSLIRQFRDEVGVPFIAADGVLEADCDVLTPCALGGVLNEQSIPLLRCAAVAGSANNQLAEEADGDRIRGRGILYAPDFVASVGGAMAISGIEALGWATDQAEREVADYVPRTLHRIFDVADAEDISTNEAARRLAEEHLRS
jgi:leucine dehydrogenase